MLWFVLVMVLVIIAASVLVGRYLGQSRGGSGNHRMTRQEKMNALKASGAMPQRKESRR